jgi:hypothetical protein
LGAGCIGWIFTATLCRLGSAELVGLSNSAASLSNRFGRFGHLPPLAGKFTIDNLHEELGCHYCGSIAFRGSSSADFGLFIHGNETTNPPQRFRVSLAI